MNRKGRAFCIVHRKYTFTLYHSHAFTLYPLFSIEKASVDIEKGVTSISSSVKNIEEGSSQLNSLLFPIVASIAIILALQIVIIARRR